MKAVKPSTIETVFSVGSVQSAYKRREVTSQLEAEGVSPEEFLVPRFQSDRKRNRKKTS
jgi:hypothetical protein